MRCAQEQLEDEKGAKGEAMSMYGFASWMRLSLKSSVLISVDLEARE